MGFLEFVKKGIKIGMLDRDAASEVATMPDATGSAALTFAIAGLAGGVSAAVTTGGLGFIAVVVMPVVMLVFYAVMVLVLHLLASMMGGKATYTEYFRGLGAGAVVLWLAVFPIVGALSGFWYLPVSVIVTERVHGLSMGKAIAVVLIPFFAMLVLVFIAFMLGLLAVMGVTSANMNI